SRNGKSGCAAPLGFSRPAEEEAVSGPIADVRFLRAVILTRLWPPRVIMLHTPASGWTTTPNWGVHDSVFLPFSLCTVRSMPRGYRAYQQFKAGFNSLRQSSELVWPGSGSDP